jgi:hypothetical protein
VHDCIAAELAPRRRVFVQLSNGKVATCSVGKDGTVDALKEQVSIQTGLSVDGQVWTLNGVPLEGSSIVSRLEAADLRVVNVQSVECDRSAHARTRLFLSCADLSAATSLRSIVGYTRLPNSDDQLSFKVFSSGSPHVASFLCFLQRLFPEEWPNQPTALSLLLSPEEATVEPAETPMDQLSELWGHRRRLYRMSFASPSPSVKQSM